MQLLTIGIMGEYIGRIYDEVKGRPHYLVKETSANQSFELPGSLPMVDAQEAQPNADWSVQPR